MLALALAAVLTAAPADARREAGAHYTRAISLYKEGNFSAALSEFKAAFAAAPSWEVYFNIGLCQRRLFQYGQALRSFDRYLAEGGPRVPAARHAAVQQELKEIRALTAPVAVIVKGPSATVLVDGDALGVTPLSDLVLLGPGKHVVRAEREGCAPDEKTIEVVSGQAQAVELDPRSLTAPGRVRVECTPVGALVTIDGREEGACPLARELAPGSHELSARAEDHALLRTEVVVQPATPRTVHLALVPTTRPFPVLGVGLLGGGVALGALGTVFALLATGAAKDVSALSSAGGPWDANAIATQAAGQRHSALGWTFIGLGVASAAAGGVVLGLQAGRAPALALVPGPTGVLACGSF